jgi:hypothetical protein
MVLPVLAAFAKAAAPYVIPAIAGAINQKNQNDAAMDAYNKQRAAEKADQANKFVDMRNAAQKAGFNPLTVLRATGGAGYGGTNAVMPVMSKQNFVATFAAKAAGQYYENKANAPIDAYNQQVRNLDIYQRGLDIKISKQTLKNMGVKPQQVATSVPLMDPSTGKQVINKSGPVFVDAVAQEAIPKYRTVYDQSTGKTFAILNPEITEMGGPLEIMVSQGILASAETSAETARGMEFKIPGFNTSVGWPQDPLDFNKGFRFPNSDNTQYAKPQLSF